MSLERQEHNENNPWWGEHVHRYNEALSYIPNLGKVLDIACGNGFGSHILSTKTTDMVIGADISEDAVNQCSLKFTNTPNLKFKIVDGTNMPFEDNYFDTIISFETIEHTTQYKQMLTEFYRTLKSGAVAIISTPNIIVNSPTGVVLNPYHTQEFNYTELEQILNSTFNTVKIFGQKYIRYKNKSIRNTIGKIVESFLYLRGIRKMPLSIQNSVMQLIVKKPMYPTPTDFELTSDKNEILKCKTFFTVCYKK
jgi:ubiquinone/menaquinone biosynthesis C-methylase UbiE